MSEFYKKHCLSKSGEGPGGKFNGPSIKYILREDNLFDLENRLENNLEEAVQFTNYFWAIRIEVSMNLLLLVN